jgi:hypothetical protein
MNLADPLECPPEWGLWCREKLSSRRLALSFAKITDDPQLWRSILIVLVILAILFGALLLRHADTEAASGYGDRPMTSAV